MSQEFDFSAKLKQLEEITAWFESEDIDLDQGLKKFEQGMQLAAELRQYLAKVENKVELIKRKFDGSAAPAESEPEEPAPAPDLFNP